MKRRRHSNGVYFDRSTKGEVGENKETIADIITEASGVFDELRKHGYNVVSVDRMEDIIDRVEEAHKREREAAAKREVEELRECLKEAIREKCPFTRMSCKHGEPCDYVCGTDKWRKAMEGAEDESK